MRGAVVGSGAAAAGTISAMQLAGAPWGAIVAVAAVCALVAAVVALAQTMIPQDSGDRLEWWRDRRRHKVLRRRSGMPSVVPAQPRGPAGSSRRHRQRSGRLPQPTHHVARAPGDEDRVQRGSRPP